MLSIYGKSHIGEKRHINEDTMKWARLNEECALVVVCDGMGGHSGGDIASRLAAGRLTSEVLTGYRESMTDSDLTTLLRDGFLQADSVIKEMAMVDSSLDGMGTTAVCALCTKNRAYIANMGDSRAYKISKNKIEQITVDHSLVQEMMEQGQLTEKQAKEHPQKNLITKALGVVDIPLPDIIRTDFVDDDILCLCTDGLTNHLSDDEIYKIVKKNKLENCPDILIDLANERGGVDNITVAVISRENII